MFDAFDIPKKLPDGGVVWIESAKDLESARERIKLFATFKPGEYVVFSQETQSVIAMPWVSFSHQEGERMTPRTATKKQGKKKIPVVASVRPTADEVVAKIVVDIARILRH